MTPSALSTKVQMPEYNVGDSHKRPWGEYLVTAVGTTMAGREYCEKNITIYPGKILSLQSHEMRWEKWKVIEGTLTVILEDKVMRLEPGQSVEIPLKAIHAMANTENVPCVVFERQEGTCREDDIIRYVDAYGRRVLASVDSRIAASIAAYTEIMSMVAVSGIAA